MMPFLSVLNTLPGLITGLAGLVFLLIFLFALYAYWRFQRIKPPDRTCENCPVPVKINGFDLYIRKVGIENLLSSPVFLLHGGPGHSSISFKQSFDFLSAEHQVIYYDQRGSGFSQSQSTPGAYTIENLVAELEILRKDVIKTEQIILIGHSFGGALAQRYALVYPERVKKLILIGSIRINNKMGNRFIWKWFGPALYTIAMGLPPMNPQKADSWFSKGSADLDGVSRLFDHNRTDILNDTGPIRFTTWRDLSFSITGNNYHKELGKLNIPTFFIYGIADSPFTGKPVAEELNMLMPNCTSICFDKSGHFPFLEEPKKFQLVIQDIINQK